MRMTDRQTDRQTDRIAIGVPCVALRYPSVLIVNLCLYRKIL